MRSGWTCLALLLAAGAVPAQPEPEQTVRMTIRPRAEPVPALKYRLLPELEDQLPGNGALFYHRAMEFRSPAQAEEKMSQWLEVPLKEFPRAEVRSTLAGYKNAVHEVDLGARRRRCDWGLEFRTEGFGLLLPEIQAMRSLVTLVALQARLEIAEGHYDQAVHTLQTGFAMAKHVGAGETLIQYLVGMAIARVIDQRVEELIQAPGAPNLYWALTGLPRPLVDLREPLQGEKVMFLRQFPQLHALTTESLSPQQVQKLAESVLQEWAKFDGSLPPLSRTPFLEMKLAITLLTAKSYPQAKRFLKSQGKTQEQIEAMPALQAVMIYSLHEYDRQRDDLFKWMCLPYWQASAGLQRAEQELRRSKNSLDAGFPLGPLLLPAVQRVFFTSARTDRRIAVLRCIEAVRLYAAAHDGKLPAGLRDITEVPVPDDPVTGKAFDYKLAEGKAILVGPPPSGEGPRPSDNTFRYELTVAR